MWEGFFQLPKMTSLDNPTSYGESARTNMPKLDAGIFFKQCSFRNPAWFVQCAICYSKYAGNSLLCISSLLKWLVELIINKQQDIRFIVTLLDGWLITGGS